MSSPIFRYFFLLFIILFAFTSCDNTPKNAPPIKGKPWSSNALTWDDFVEVDSLEDGFHANIYSEIIAPKKFSKMNSMVYAYMDPTQSEQVRDTAPRIQLLKHEQYHFNITEYHARLLRRELVKRGDGKISRGLIKHWYNLLESTRDFMQEDYDDESDHNGDYTKQRYWELKIDDLLREVDYYHNPDLNSYYAVAPESKSMFFRKVYHTFDQEVLTAYPIREENAKYGEVYKMEKTKDTTTVSFYKNSKLSSDGEFDTPITQFIQLENEQVEIRYLNEEGALNPKLDRAILRVTFEENGNRTMEYFDAQEQPSLYRNVQKKTFVTEQEGRSWYGSYFNLNGEPTANEDLAYHERRKVDSKGRTILFNYFDANNQPMLDDNYVFSYEYKYNKTHQVVHYKMRRADGKFATHLSEYNFKFRYDERGNAARIENLDTLDRRTENGNGICIQEFVYDRYDHVTSVKRFNRFNNPVLGYEDYHQKVADYDSLGRLIYSAKYYPEYVLAFTENRTGATRYEYPNDSTQISYNVDAFGNVFSDDLGFAIVEKVYNGKKELISESYRNEEDVPMTDSEGVAIYTYEYDEDGNKVAQAGYGLDGKPTFMIDDVAAIRWDYDKSGNKIKTTYFNKEKQLANTKDNVTYNTYTYDDKNNMTGRAYFDKAMQPILLEGRHRIEFYPDARGNDTLVKEFDTKNRLIRKNPITRAAYNEYGTQLFEAVYDVDDTPSLNKDGVSKIVFLHDEFQRYKGHENYDAAGIKTNDANGIFSEIRTLDQAGYISSYEYFDKNGEPVLGEDGYHKAMYVLDDYFTVTEEATFDTKGNLIPNAYGVARYSYTRAPSSLSATIRMYDAKDRPFEDKDGVFEIHYRHSMNGLYYMEKQFDANGKWLNPPDESITELLEAGSETQEYDLETEPASEE